MTKKQERIFFWLVVALVAILAVYAIMPVKAQVTKENACVEVRITDPDPYPVQLRYQTRLLGMMLTQHQLPVCMKEADKEYKITVSLFYGIDCQLCAFCLYLSQRVEDDWEILHSGYMYKVAGMQALLSGVEREFQEALEVLNDNNL